MEDQIKKSENCFLRAFNPLSENSLKDTNNVVQTTRKTEIEIFVQCLYPAPNTDEVRKKRRIFFEKICINQVTEVCLIYKWNIQSGKKKSLTNSSSFCPTQTKAEKL